MRVIRLKPYLRAMQRMGFDDDAMRDVETMILAAPAKHPMIKGLRGVRKARFARPGRGRSGGGRAIYYLALSQRQLLMLAAYPKSQQVDLTPADRQAILRALDIYSGRAR